MYIRQNAARYLKNSSKRVIFCPECTNIHLIITSNQQEMNYHMAKKHAQPSSSLKHQVQKLTGGPSNILTRKAVVDETIIKNSSNGCKTIAGIDAS